MNNPDVEAPLSPAEVKEILAICSTRGLLVGGQALAFWADHLEVPLPPDLVSGVTADADFVGDFRLAKDLAKRLGWKAWIPTLDDATPQTGKVTHRVAGGGGKQVDFFSGVIGLAPVGIVRRAVEMDGPRIGRLCPKRPNKILGTRLQTLHLLARKCTPA